MHQKANFWLPHRTKLPFYQEVDFRGMGNCLCHFYTVFSMIFQYQQIRCTDLIEVKIIFFSSFNWLCQVPAYLLRGSITQTWHTVHGLNVKNRDPVFGFQVNRPHLETGERCTKQKCYPNSIFWQNRKLIWINPLALEGLWSTPACFTQKHANPDRY